VPLVLYLGFRQGAEGKEPLSWVNLFIPAAPAQP